MDQHATRPHQASSPPNVTTDAYDSRIPTLSSPPCTREDSKHIQAQRCTQHTCSHMHTQMHHTAATHASAAVRRNNQHTTTTTLFYQPCETHSARPTHIVLPTMCNSLKRHADQHNRWYPSSHRTPPQWRTRYKATGDRGQAKPSKTAPTGE